MKRLAFLFLLVLPMAANAVPIVWEVNANLRDSGAISGAFTYDADTGQLTDAALSTPGSISGGLLFTDYFDFFGTVAFYQPGASSAPTIALRLEGLSLSNLTNAGGVLTLNSGGAIAEIMCSAFPCSGGSAVSNFANATWTVRGAPLDVPEPGTLALLGIGLAGIGFARRRRQA